MMKQAGPVLDPTNYAPETYNALLEGRRKVLYNNLQDIGYTPEQIQKLSAQHEYTPYGGRQESAPKAPQSAIDHLKSHPELKSQFKEKYGYLPEGV
jgi:hypothetical protein